MTATATNFFSGDDAGTVPLVRSATTSAIRSPANAPSIAILGIPFDNVTTAETVAAVEDMVASRQPHYLVTANVDFLVQARKDIELRRILLDAHLVLCDGTPLLWASRLLGNPLPERVAGSDLVPLLIRIAEKKNYRIFFLGGSLDAAETATVNVQKQHPRLLMAGHYSPKFADLLDMDHDEIRRKIHEAKPDLLFVSFGCPKQEKWISMHYRSLGVPVCVGVGATIDFIAGKVKRAPKWMQKTGTEWTFRVAQEPRRLVGRYAKCLWWFSREIAYQWWRMQRSGDRAKIAHTTSAPEENDTWKTVKLPERLDVEAVRRDSLLCEQALATHRNCLIDLSRVKFVDSTGVGLLISLQKKARVTGQRLILLSPSEAVLSALRQMRLDDFFAIARDLPDAKRISDAHENATAVAVQQNYFPSKPGLFWRNEVTAANAEFVWQITQAHIASRGNSKAPLQIDLSALQFIDSTGVGLMVRAKKTAVAQGIELRFVGIQPTVRSVLRFSKLESYLLGAGG